MKRFVLEQSTKEYYSSHSGLALVGLALNRFTDISGIGRKGLGISDADVLKSYLGLLALGVPYRLIIYLRGVILSCLPGCFLQSSWKK